MRIQCDLAGAPHDMQTKRIALLDRISCTLPELCHAAQHDPDPDRGCVEAKWSLQPGPADPHRIRIQSPMWRAPDPVSNLI